MRPYSVTITETAGDAARGAVVDDAFHLDRVPVAVLKPGERWTQVVAAQLLPVRLLLREPLQQQLLRALRAVVGRWDRRLDAPALGVCPLDDPPVLQPARSGKLEQPCKAVLVVRPGLAELLLDVRPSEPERILEIHLLALGGDHGEAGERAVLVPGPSLDQERSVVEGQRACRPTTACGWSCSIAGWGSGRRSASRISCRSLPSEKPPGPSRCGRADDKTSR